jgi:AmmeMemoRadiSam system protein A
MISAPERHPPLDPEKGKTLLALARGSLKEKFGRTLTAAEAAARESGGADPSLQARCGTFVTLVLEGRLRGCIGSLAPAEPIAAGVQRNALNAAFHDPRFSPLTEAEFDRVKIEVSVLTEPRPLAFEDGADLAARLRPKLDGVILRKGYASATFLPQVWEQLPRPEEFLGHLCLKAGLKRDAWKQPGIEVSTYQVQYFEE